MTSNQKLPDWLAVLKESVIQQLRENQPVPVIEKPRKRLTKRSLKDAWKD